MRRRFSTACRASTVRLDSQRFVKTFPRVRQHSLREVSPAEIEVWEMPRFVTWGQDGLFQPGNRFVVASHLDQVRTDVVVGISKFRIDFNRSFAFRDGVFDLALKMVGPTQEGMRFRAGKDFQRAFIQNHCLVVVAVHLHAIRLLQQGPRLLLRVSRHAIVWSPSRALFSGLFRASTPDRSCKSRDTRQCD